MTVERIIRHNFCIYKGIFFDDFGNKISFIKYNPIEVIIDKLKYIFGLNSFDRKILILPSQNKIVSESHNGFERKLKNEELKDYPVIKIRLFRWLVGLPNNHPSKDIIVRIICSKKHYISYRDTEIDYNRELNVSISGDLNPIDIFKEMFNGFSDITEIKELIYNVIHNIDDSYLFLINHICFKINMYNLM